MAWFLLGFRHGNGPASVFQHRPGRLLKLSPRVSACLLPLSSRELPLQHVNDLPVERAVLVCGEQLKALMERDRDPQGYLLQLAPLDPIHASLIGHRSTVPSR
jgi:hypothetical protein